MTIYKMGIEIEGAWKSKPNGAVTDGSVHGFRHDDLFSWIGEANSPAYADPGDLHAWIKANNADDVNHTCGLHVHVSTTTDQAYNKLAEKPFYRYFMARLESWANEALDGDVARRFWDRFRGNNGHCCENYKPCRHGHGGSSSSRRRNTTGECDHDCFEDFDSCFSGECDHDCTSSEQMNDAINGDRSCLVHDCEHEHDPSDCCNTCGNICRCSDTFKAHADHEYSDQARCYYYVASDDSASTGDDDKADRGEPCRKCQHVYDCENGDDDHDYDYCDHDCYENDDCFRSHRHGCRHEHDDDCYDAMRDCAHSECDEYCGGLPEDDDDENDASDDDHDHGPHVPSKQRYDRGKGSARYAHLNYCQAYHGTLEIRLFPSMPSPDLTIAAVDLIRECVETYLAGNAVMPPAEDEIPVVVSVPVNDAPQPAPIICLLSDISSVITYDQEVIELCA